MHNCPDQSYLYIILSSSNVWTFVYSNEFMLSSFLEVVNLKDIIIWLAPRAGKMTQIARCDWPPERARWNHLARSGLPAVSRKQNFPKSHIINPLLTKFVRSRWLDINLVLFFFASFLSAYKHTKKELGHLQPSLPHTRSITHIPWTNSSFIARY